ncbi:MAG: hypothetical protein RJS97_00840 [Parvibaculaceae bacterium]
MEIQIGVGLDDFKFGMSASEVKRRLGPPDKIDRDEEEFPLFLFNKLRSTFWFDSKSRLHWIQCSHRDAVLLGSKPIGAQAPSILSSIESHLGESWELVDYGSIESYSFSEAELEIQTEYGLIRSICFGHLWEGDTPLYAIT